MRRILAPHKEQDGYAYLRVMRYGHDEHGRQQYLVEQEPYEDGEQTVFGLASFAYHDGASDARTISSRRVEEAVETADYLKRCAEEDLDVRCWGAVFDTGEKANATGLWWAVMKPSRKRAIPAGSPTLREAYHRCHNAKEA